MTVRREIARASCARRGVRIILAVDLFGLGFFVS